MALDSRNKRASSVGMLLGCLLAPPEPTGTIDQGTRQHIAWTYRGILAQSGIVIGRVSDLTTRIRVYLCAFYSTPDTSDNTWLVSRYLRNDATGDYTARMLKLIQAATDAQA